MGGGGEGGTAWGHGIKDRKQQGQMCKYQDSKGRVLDTLDWKHKINSGSTEVSVGAGTT